VARLEFATPRQRFYDRRFYEWSDTASAEYRVMKAFFLAALLVAVSAPVALAQRPSNEPLPEIHPNDRNPATVQQRIDEIRRSGDIRDQPQMNSLESLQQQQRGNSPAVAPLTPADRRTVPDRAPTSRPEEWPGYRPGYLPRQ
jgi:hypothetical protein